MTYPERIVLSLDQLLNTLVGGYPDETLSARCYRQGVLNARKPWPTMYWLVNHLFFWQENHCRKAYERELAQGHTSNQYREP